MDAAAIDTALREHDPLVLRIVSRISWRGSRCAELGDFDDALQLARIAAWRACRSWRHDGGRSLPSWIGENVKWALWGRAWAWKNRRPPPPRFVRLEDVAHSAEPGVEHEWPDLDAPGSTELWRRVRRVVGRRNYEILLRRFVDRAALQEVAEEQGVSKQRVQQRTLWSLQALRCRIRQLGGLEQFIAAPLERIAAGRKLD